eukprot:6340379-Amphidinium_carterae.1
MWSVAFPLAVLGAAHCAIEPQRIRKELKHAPHINALKVKEMTLCTALHLLQLPHQNTGE